MDLRNNILIIYQNCGGNQEARVKAQIIWCSTGTKYYRQNLNTLLD